MAEVKISLRDNTHTGLLSLSSSPVSMVLSPSPRAAATASDSSSSSLQSLSARWMWDQQKQHDEAICQQAKHQCREEKLLRAECQQLRRHIKELDLSKSQLSRHISQLRDANQLGSKQQNSEMWWVGMDVTCVEQNNLDQEVDPIEEEEQHHDLEAIFFTEGSIENFGGGNHADDWSVEYEASEPQDINNEHALDDFKGPQIMSVPTVNGDGRKSESIPLAKFEEELLLLQALSFRERVALQEKTQRLKQFIVQQYVLYQEIEDEEKAFQAVELGQSLWQTVVAKLKIHSLSTDMARLEQLCQDLGAVVALYSDHNPLWTNQTGFEGSSESTTEPILTEVQTDFTSELDHLNLKEDRSENGVKERHGVALMMTDFSPGRHDQTVIRTHYPETELATEAFMQQHRKRDVISSAAKRLDFESIVNDDIYERNSSTNNKSQRYKTGELNLDKRVETEILDLEPLNMKDDGAHMADLLCESKRVHDNFEQGDGQESLEIFSPESDDLFSISSWEKNGGKLSPRPGLYQQINQQKSLEIISPANVGNLFTLLSPGKADDTPSQQKSEVNIQGESSHTQVLELHQTTQESEELCSSCNRDGTTVLPYKSEFLHSVPYGSSSQIESEFSKESALPSSQNNMEKVFLQGKERGLLQPVCGEELETQGLKCTTVSGKKTTELDRICSKQGEDLRSLNKKLEELAQQLESQIRMREDLELRWELQLSEHLQEDGGVQLAMLNSTLLSNSLMVQSAKPNGILMTVEHQRELSFSELSKAKKLQCAAESEAKALNNQVQNLEALCDNAHKMEVLRIKDEAMWTCLLTLLQFSLLCLNFILWLHRFTDSWGNSFPT